MVNTHIVPYSDLNGNDYAYVEGENMRYFEEYKKLYYTSFYIKS